ncbi:hypothetical protein Rmet_5810 (plasmid) [Cupriavidus metallidurans CH34]|uniref:Uncharacterized protein n=1 Tax=Cupriavidus metallidurans (strain ATCC 43123 / DSM 2839 / NBRC 102507 / CH34) TaxID=266264 RepID=Q1LB07_CUPMC|nr:hypothetical protein Rmet_5810 [Cupriavidus metallidurans CH34]
MRAVKHRADTPARVDQGTITGRVIHSPGYQEAIVIRTMLGRSHVVRDIGLTLCLTFCLGTLAGCDRNQAPGPGPKPISSNGSQAAATSASSPAGTPR